MTSSSIAVRDLDPHIPPYMYPLAYKGVKVESVSDSFIIDVHRNNCVTNSKPAAERILDTYNMEHFHGDTTDEGKTCTSSYHQTKSSCSIDSSDRELYDRRRTLGRYTKNDRRYKDINRQDASDFAAADIDVEQECISDIYQVLEWNKKQTMLVSCQIVITLILLLQSGVVLVCVIQGRI